MAKVIQQQWVSNNYTPADRTVTETIKLFAIPAGWRVVAASCRILTANVGGAPTLELGDSGDVDRFMKTGDFTIGTTGLYDGLTGAGLLVSGGYLVTTATTIDVVYTGAAGSTTSVVARFRVTVQREEP